MSQASGLPYTVSLQDDFILNNAMGAVTISSAQVVSQNYPATSQSLNQIQFQNIKLSGASSLFDSQWLLEYDVTVQADLRKGQFLPGLLFNQNATISGGSIAIDNNTFPILSNAAGQIFSTNIGNLSFRELPLSRNCSSLQVSLNNQNQQNYALQQQLAVSDPLTEEDKNRLSGLTPVDSPKSVFVPNFYTLSVPAGATSGSALTLTIDDNYKGGVNQPNNPYFNSGRNFVNVKSLSSNVAVGVYSATYTIREPILADPFTVGYSGAAIGNLDSISITYNIDYSNSLQGMFVASKNYLDGSTLPPLLSGLSITGITGCRLLTRTFAVDPSVVNIPPVIYYDYSQYTFNTTQTAVPIGSASATTQTQSIALNTVPKMYVMKIQPLSNGLSPNTSTQIGATIESITVNYGTLGTFVFNQVQLYQAFVRNSKVEKNFNEWLDDCVIMLNPALDFQNTASSFTGIANLGTLTFNLSQVIFNCKNYVYGGCVVPASISINEMFINQGSLAVGMGQATYTTTTISSGQLVAALDKPLVSHKVLHSSASGQRVLRGGGIFSSLGNVLRGAASAIPSVLNTAQGVLSTAQGALSHPMVQSALGALSGGSMRRGRR